MEPSPTAYVVDPTTVRAARDRIQPIRMAIVAGDVAAFRVALFGDTPGVVSQGMADDLRYGFMAPKSTLDNAWSLAEACFHHNRPEMLRIALEADHPEFVAGLMTGSKAAWLSHLCTRCLQGDDISAVCLGSLAIWQNNAQTREFLEIAVEYSPDSAGLDAISANDAQGHALITEAAMRVRLRSEASNVGHSTAHTPAPRRAQRTL